MFVAPVLSVASADRDDFERGGTALAICNGRRLTKPGCIIQPWFE